jgi:glucose dehydrogenase
MMIRSLRLMTITSILVCFVAASGEAQVTFDRVLNANREPQNWLTYSGSLTGQRYSPLTAITPANVKNLELVWVLQTRAPAEPTSKYESTSLVVDGVLYSVQPPNVIVAVDAATGRVFWTYAYNPSAAARACCGRVNRGLAILGHTLFMGTIDGNLVAVDARDGRLLWNTPIGKPEAGYSVTVAPLVVKDKVIACRRRVRHQRLFGRVRSCDREAGVEIQNRPGTRRTRQRDLGRRFLDAWQWLHLDDRFIRSGAEPDLLGRRQSRTGLERKCPYG